MVLLEGRGKVGATMAAGGGKGVAGVVGEGEEEGGGMVIGRRVGDSRAVRPKVPPRVPQL
jgi:hypothetical protein